MKRVQVLGIDVIRFFAATSVVVWHFLGKPFLTPERATLHPLMPSAGPSIPSGVEQIWFGWIGVQIFFVVSGVVIAFSADRATPRSFFIGRFVRLWPAMLVSASICTVLSIIFWKTSVIKAVLRFFSSLTFFPLGPWFSGQVWTLPIEIVFYSLVWLLIFGKRVDWLERLAWGLCLVSFAYWIARTADLVPAIMHLRLLLLFHGCYFALGIILAKASNVGWSLPRVLLVLLCIVTAVLEIGSTAANELSTSIYRYNKNVPILVWLVASAAIMASLHWKVETAEFAGKMAGICKLMGKVTYPLYLVHYQTGGPIFAALVGLGWSIWAAFIPAYLVALGISVVIVRYFEPPLVQLLRQWFERLPQFGKNAAHT